MFDFLLDLYPWTKALHVISMIAWMSGVFYLPRLFVYHSQNDTDIVTRNKFKIMEYKLYKYIMNPALYSMWFFGLLCLFTPGIIDFSTDIWFHVKLILVISISAFHFYLGYQVNIFSMEENKHPEKFFRMINEIPTFLMIFIVILVIVRPF
jgi:putative membrane protein